MILIEKQPGDLILDSDSNYIEIASTDPGKLTIETNNTLLNQITIAKYNATNAKINLKGVFRNSLITTTAINDKLAKVNNTYSIYGSIRSEDNQAVIDPIDVIYSTKSIEAINQSPVSFLGISDTLLYSSYCTLSIPFFISEVQNVIIRIYDQKNNSVDFSLVGELQPGYYLYQKPLALEYEVESLIFEVEAKTTIKKSVRIIKNNKNKPLNIRFKNQFGATIYCQLFANVQVEEELSPQVYRDQNGRSFLTDIESKSTITLDTGYLLNSELFLIRQILNSLEVEIELQGKYIEVISSTKKVVVLKNREFLTTNKLTFTYNNYEAN